MNDILHFLKMHLRTRYQQLMAVLLVFLIILSVRLFVVTVIQHEKWSDSAKDISTKSIYITAPRGEIYDRNGKLLAGNKQSFSVRMMNNQKSDKELNKTAISVIRVIEKNKDKLVDNFPIKLYENKYSYTYDSKIKKWLSKKNLRSNLSAEEAFNAMRSKLGIDPALSRFDAQKEMQNTYNQFPPISVSEMKFTAEQEKENFLTLYFGDDKESLKLSAKEAFSKIRKKMNINPSISDKKARKIMQIRYELDSLGYNKYMPATIAKKVSNKTVLLLEEGTEKLDGVEVVSETRRYYPNDNTAAHVLGYMGKINDAEKDAYSRKGYETSALIGKEGIEGKFESTLAGINGEKKVQVNNKGQTSRVLGETQTKKGKDIYLTIDLDLQKTAENALRNTIYAMNYGGAITSKYGTSPTAKAAPNVKTGAVVAVEVKTGDVLAMASFPNYNPNVFANGISDSNWDKLQSKNPRDSLSPAPLYNLATMATVQPGSTFKPITAIAGMQCGLNPFEYRTDGGAINLGGRTFACVIWNMHHGSSHGALNMFRALAVSCNYYFYDVATGKDWYSGGSMGYKKKITIDQITDYAQQFGLGKKTGIEINEANVPVPTKQRKIEGLRTNLRNELYAGSEEYFNASVVKDQQLLKRNIETIVSWVDKKKDITWEQLYDTMLPRVGIKDSKRRKVGLKVLYDYYPQADWTTADAFNICIGQGENSYTPLQMANYIATLGNGGVHNQVSLIKAIQGQGNNLKPKPTKVKVDDKKYFDYVIRGMRLVATSSESTVSKIFGKMKIPVAAKTGTAEKEGRVNPESEVAYIKAHLSGIAPSLSWGKVNKEMKRLMKKYPTLYATDDVAVRRAVINLTNGKVDGKDIDQYKSKYDPFAWVVAMAPADDPQIAVCAMVPQGSTAANAAPIIKEVISKYFDSKEKYSKYKIRTVIE